LGRPVSLLVLQLDEGIDQCIERKLQAPVLVNQCVRHGVCPRLRRARYHIRDSTVRIKNTMSHSRALLLALIFTVLSPAALPPSAAGAGSAQHPWLDPSLSPDRRAGLLLRAMTRSEKLSLVFGYFGTVMPSAHYTRPPQARPG